jgi:hypothetical protein
MSKQFIGQVAMDEQQPSLAFSDGGGFLWGQQSMSSMEEDMLDMSADFAAIAVVAPAAVGSVATDSASKRIRMVRPRCMVRVACSFKIADFWAVWSSDDLALVLEQLEGQAAETDRVVHHSKMQPLMSGKGEKYAIPHRDIAGRLSLTSRHLHATSSGS